MVEMMMLMIIMIMDIQFLLKYTNKNVEQLICKIMHKKPVVIPWILA